MARTGCVPRASGVNCAGALWRVTQRAKSGDGFFACIIIAVKPKSITMNKIKTTTKAIHLKWKITWLHLIGYGARAKNKNPEAMCVGPARGPHHGFNRAANPNFISVSWGNTHTHTHIHTNKHTQQIRKEPHGQLTH